MSLNLYAVQVIEFLQAIQLLLTGKISPKFIKPETITQLYADINKNLQKNYPSFFLTNEDLSAFYNIPFFLFYAIDDHLYIQVKLPLSSYQSTFSVYKVQSVALPIHNNQTTTYTEYSNLPTYLAISLDLIYFMELTDDQYHACTEETPIKHCLANNPIQSISRPTCAVAIYNNNLPQATALCRSTLLINKPPADQIIPLGNNLYFFVNPSNVGSELSLLCDPVSPKYTVRACSLCTVAVPCSCTLQGPTFIIPKSLTNCDKNPSTSSSEITTQFQFNLNFLSNFLFNTTTLEALSAQSSVKSIPQLQLPEFIQSLPTVPPYLDEEDRQLSLNMKEVVKTIQDHKVSDLPSLLKPSTIIYRIPHNPPVG
jgi:hypothetical protein